MTTEEFINLVKTCKNRKELLQKMGGYENTSENIQKYIVPLRKKANLTPQDLTNLFKTKNDDKSQSVKKQTNAINISQNKVSLKITRN
jgi:hypothetical protein